MQEAIYDPDGLIEAYSRHFGIDLHSQKADAKITYTSPREQEPFESRSSGLVKKVAIAH